MFAIIISIIPVLYSYVVLLMVGVLNSFGRFNPMELVHVNQYARGLGFVIILACWFLFQKQKSSTSLGLIVFSVSSMVLILLTGSRGGFLATAFGVVTLLVVNRGISKARKVQLVVLITAVVAIMLVLGIGSVSSRMSNLRNVDLSVAGRVGMLKAAWEHKWDQILFGHGTGNFASILPAWAVGANLRHPHNIFVEYYIEWGIIGLSIFFLIFFAPLFAWLKIRRSSKTRGELENLADLAFALLVFSAVNGATNSAITDPMFFLAIGLMVSVDLKLSRDEDKCT